MTDDNIQPEFLTIVLANFYAESKSLLGLAKFTPFILNRFPKSVQCSWRPFPVAVVAEWYRYRTVACLVSSSRPVPLKTIRVGQRCTLNLSRAETSSRWCGVLVSRVGCQLRCHPRPLIMV
ncbi:uncharacterized protein TNCV_211151 [Trichonephila clavipes]|uniref:Uncharacterized protein n=1 Tax=Trichonephila clavipes TaxID=2585209 RepID=A0A8X6VS27_TRICX|nr:uncharacterized protein TNCV_211151 [Trichonephila clavipes]